MPTQHVDPTARSSRVVIFGTARARRDKIAKALHAEGIGVTVLDDMHETETSSFSGLVIVEEFPPLMDWDHWWEREADTWETFEAILPRLRASSRGLLVAFSMTDRPRKRAHMRGGIAHLISQFEATAAMERGIDFGINALEVPPSADAKLVDDRITAHMRTQHSTLANRVVVKYEQLRKASIAEATTAEFI
ncbi:hypothetical protein [Microbacterium sp. LMI1-1-1.1]|uniref:hypothetical protein n=1 Tax=Microbacterium sp. LMI1-1-1.1 TaxID=3135223 RepID=UPI003464F576